MKIGNGICGIIYAGSTRVNKNGMEIWIKKTEITDEAIKAVFQWFISQSQMNENKPYEITFKGHGTLTYKPENKEVQP